MSNKVQFMALKLQSIDYRLLLIALFSETLSLNGYDFKFNFLAKFNIEANKEKSGMAQFYRKIYLRMYLIVIDSVKFAL